jgi:UMF1 family MFS transporter
MKYRQLMLFLAAFWLYSDGIGTIMKMAVAYGDEIGIDVSDLVLALIITQFVGIPCSFAFGWLAGRIGTRIAILVGLTVYALISVGAYFMTSATHFYILAFAVGLVQGGTQALSRSLYGSMVPKKRSAEFFGFYSASSKFAGILGPLLFGLVSQSTGSSRLSILSIVLFFVLGAVLLSFVDVDEGRRRAQGES